MTAPALPTRRRAPRPAPTAPTLTPERRRQIEHLVARKRRQHGISRFVPFTYRTAADICAREDIVLHVVRLPDFLLGRAVAMPNMLRYRGATHLVLLNARCPERMRAHVVAHELAHCWLHADPEQPGVLCRGLFYARRGIAVTIDLIEVEAEYVAHLLVGTR